MTYGKVIGIGNTATVYEWGADKVLKLFYKGYPKEAVELEYRNAMAVRDMDFAKPKGYEILVCEDRMGIVYDRVEGETLLEWVLRTGDVRQCAEIMAKLHKKVLQNSISNVRQYKDFLLRSIEKGPRGNTMQREEALQLLAKLPEDQILCHGDFHPGNILMVEGQPVVIDFMNVCQGSYLYDVARTIFLVEYTPVPEGADNREGMMQLKRALADEYLIQMNVTRNMIEDYITILALARAGEME